MGVPGAKPHFAANMAPRTIVEKIWDGHEIADLGGGQSLLHIDRIFLHERMGPALLAGLAEAGRAPAHPELVFGVIDHAVETLPGRLERSRQAGANVFVTGFRDRAKAAGIRLFDLDDPRQGIVHVVSPEQGIALPGCTLVCPDSHTGTVGGIGALAWGIGSTEAEHALATGTLRVTRPRTMRVTVSGRLPRGVTAKDLSLALIGRHGAAGGNGYAIEYAGAAVRHLDVEARLTLCNMATEFSAMTGMIAPDDKTLAYLKGRRYAPSGADWEAAVAQWRTLVTDAGASFDREVEIAADDLAPMVTWGTSPQHAARITDRVPSQADSGTSPEAYARALAYMGLEPGMELQSLDIGAAFIGSCTNSRISDLRHAAGVLRGRRVAPGVRAICVPGSMSVKRQAEAEGLDRVFLEAGFEWRESGCSMCFFAGGESFGPQQRVVSSTNRNFESRQGPQTRTHIASPETVAASAVAGRLADVRALLA